MDCKTWFDPHIRKVIDLFSHPVWFILLEQNYTCSCVDHATKIPDASCQKCLGTGKKVHLTRVWASNQNTTSTYSGINIGHNEKEIVNVYYTKQRTDIKVGDWVLDANCFDEVVDVYYERSDDNKIVYWRIETRPIKNNTKQLLSNIDTVLQKAGYK